MMSESIITIKFARGLLGEEFTAKNGKAICVDLPADGETTVTKSHLKGKDPDGKNLWEDERYKVSNSQLKEMVEFYKKKPRENAR